MYMAAHNGRQIAGGPEGAELFGVQRSTRRKLAENYTLLPVFPDPSKGLRVNKMLVCASSGCTRIAASQGIIQRLPVRSEVNH